MACAKWSKHIKITKNACQGQFKRDDPSLLTHRDVDSLCRRVIRVKASVDRLQVRHIAAIQNA